MQERDLERNTVIGLIAGVGLAAGKLVAGIAGNSSALVADSVESLADSVGSLVVWRAIRVAGRPPDTLHPYGYGRAETLAALGVGALLLVASGVIVVKAVGDMLTPHEAPMWWTICVLIVVMAVKEGLFRLILRGAELTRSEAARADAWHQRSDAITSGAALVGVSLAVWGPGWFGDPRLVIADEAAAIVAAGIIVVTAVRLMRPAWREALDIDAPELAAELRRTAEGVEGVRVVEKVRVRKSGRWFYADMHLHVDPRMSVFDAHALSGKVRATLRATHVQVRDVLIHIEPDIA